MSCNSPAAVVSYAIGAVPHGCRRFGCQKRRPVGPASISRGGQTWQRLTTLLFSSLRLEGTACVLSRETSFLCLKESACSGAQAEQIWVMGNVLAVKVVCKVGGGGILLQLQGLKQNLPLYFLVQRLVKRRALLD